MKKIEPFLKIGLIGFVAALLFFGLQHTQFANALPTTALAYFAAGALFFGGGGMLRVIWRDTAS